MAFTAADLATIDAAIAAGVLKVRFSDGKEVTYASPQALMSARGFIAGQLTPPASAVSPLEAVGGVTFAEFTRA